MTQPVVQTNENNLAIASLVLGILSIVGMGPLTGIPAIITGAMALKNPVNKGMAVAGLVMGGISTVFVLLIIFVIIVGILIAALASPQYNDPGYQDYDQSEPLPYQQRA